MSVIAKLLAKAQALHGEGRLEQAEAIYQQILQRDPQQPDALHLLGVLAGQCGQPEAAIELISAAIALNGAQAAYFLSLGNNRAALGQLDDAITAFDMAIALDPDFAPAHNNLGMLRQAAGDIDGAAESFAAALARDPDHVDALNNLGTIDLMRGDVVAAHARFARAFELRPDDPVILNSLGIALTEGGAWRQAIEILTEGVRLAPDTPELLISLGNAWDAGGDLDQAADAFQRALAIAPDAQAARGNLGAVLGRLGRIDEARATLDRHWRDTGFAGSAVRQALLLPVIAQDTAEIDAARQRLDAELDRLLASDLRIGDPLAEVDATNFRLAYHGRDDRPLQEKTARVMRHLCPGLGYVAAHCDDAFDGAAGRRIRLGVVSSFLFNHTIGKLYLRLIEGLPRDRFELVLYPCRPERDGLFQRLAARADQVVPLARSLGPAIDRIADARLDLLFYPDIGMDPMTYYLAFTRLAPVQACGWGHPDTTGLTTIDHFISSRRIEPDGAVAHYTEHLVELDEPTTAYVRPRRPPAFRPMMFGLPEDRTIYVSPQSLFKYHPDYDSVLADILAGDPDGVLAMIEAPHAGWTRDLKARFARTLPDAAGRIIFLPQLMEVEYLGLLALSHVMLDPFHYSGGNSSLEAFSVGLPIVTWPGEFMRGRVTAGFYDKMGLGDLVARDRQDYVAKAVALGRDPALRGQWRARIVAADAALFDDDRPIGEFAAGLARLVADAAAR